MGFWPLIKLEGDPADRGTSYGRQAKDLIRENVALYVRFFRVRHQIDQDRLRDLAARFVPSIEALDEDLATEMRAVAQAADVDFLDIVMVNARSSLPAMGSDGCTAIGYLGHPGDDAGPLLGQNWDNMAGLKAIVLRIDQPNHPSILTLTEAGMLCKMGLNARGVGLCVNGLSAAEQAAVESVPIFCLMRKALEAGSISEAAAVITGAQRDAAHNYLFMSREGAAVDIEALPQTVDMLTPTGNTFVHTNHIISPRLPMRDEGKVRFPDTVLRLWRANALLPGKGSSFGVPDMHAVLSDHLGAPGSICHHARDAGDDLEIRTKCAIIMELRRGRMHVSAGYPCTSPLEVFELDTCDQDDRQTPG